MDHAKSIFIVGLAFAAFIIGSLFVPSPFSALYTGAVSVLLLAWVGYFTYQLRLKFTTLTRAIQSLQGNLNQPFPLQDDATEFGQLARMLEDQRLQALESVNTSFEEETHEPAQPVVVENKGSSDAIILGEFRNLQSVATSSCHMMTQLVTNLRSHVNQVGTSSKSVIKDITNLVTHAHDTYNRVDQASNIGGDLSKSIAQMHQYAEQSSRVAEQAEKAAEETDMRVNGLADATSKINDVVQLIQDIANQTHLLALNATIEAARAGEAGKGFAVVASEVKNLANQTGKATDDISQQIEQIQLAARETVTSIGSIRTIIQQVNTVSDTITSAIDQQTEWSHSLCDHVNGALKEAERVNHGLKLMESQAQDSGHASSELTKVSSDILHQSEKMQNSLAQFGRGHGTYH